jgi:CMP/dCMP kinase
VTSTPRVIAIDGAAGSGKTTLARALARALDLAYLNTGLMYRALTEAALDRGVDLDDGEALAELTRRLRFALSSGVQPELEVEGSPPRASLNSERVDAAVSRVARHPEVRELMRRAQRDLGIAGAVVEGRDIGAVVFPDAPVKLFLRADPAARVARRSEERPAPGPEVGRLLHLRDARDSVVNPLEPSAGAIVLDTTDSGPQATLAEALALVRERMPELGA